MATWSSTFFFQRTNQFLPICTQNQWLLLYVNTVCGFIWVDDPHMTQCDPPLFPHEFLIFDVWVASNIPSSDSIPQNSPNYGCFNMNFLLVESHHDVFILYPPWYPDHISMSVSENRLFDAQKSQGVLVRGVFDGLMVMNPLFLMGTSPLLYPWHSNKPTCL